MTKSDPSEAPLSRDEFFRRFVFVNFQNPVPDAFPERDAWYALYASRFSDDPPAMTDRQVIQQNILNLLTKLSDPDADLRFMSLNDLFDILTNPNSAFLTGDGHFSTNLANGLLKCLEDQHGDVQNQALKWYVHRVVSGEDLQLTGHCDSSLGPMSLRLPADSLPPLLEKLANLTTSQTIDTSVPNAALRVIVDTLPHPQTGQAAPQNVLSAYSAVSQVLIPRLTGTTPSASGRRGSVVRGMLEKDPEKGFSSDALDVLIKVVKSFGPLLQEHELAALQAPVMAIFRDDTAGTVVTKRALTAIAALVLHFSDNQLNAFVRSLTETLSSSSITIVHRKHLIAAIGVIARAAPAKIGPHIPTLVPFVYAALGEDGVPKKK